MKRTIQMLSTDFDGTLIGHPSELRCIDTLAQILSEHKAAGGIWAINTGRSLIHTLEGIEHFQPPVLPDYLVTLEREIYIQGENGGWLEHEPWNRICKTKHDELFLAVRPLLNLIREHANASEDVTLLYENNQPIGLVTTSEEVMHDVVGTIEQHSCEYPDFSYQRNTIYLRFCHRYYHKGSALEEITRITNIAPEFIFAAGDNFNDLGMLDGKYAHMPACPENAIPEVKELVAKSGGYVATRECAEGVAEAYRWFLDRRKNKPAQISALSE